MDDWQTQNKIRRLHSASSKLDTQAVETL